MKQGARLLWLMLALVAARPAGATISYRVSVARPAQHTFHVTMTVLDTHSGLVVALPAWNALYQIRDFAYRVQHVNAFGRREDPAAQLLFAVTKLDKQTWRITVPDDSSGKVVLSVVRIDYDVYWDEPGPFNSQLNAHHAFINPAEILFYVPDRRGEDVNIGFAELPAGWKSAMELPPGAGPNSFKAASYDALADAPAEIGKFDEFRFDANGAHFRAVADGSEWKEAELRDSLSRIVTYETTLMGGAPFQEYTFFFHFGPYTEVGGGGMEHANGTAIATATGASAAGVAAHEFFHAWNVKRIRPQSLEPVDYSKEMWTRSLWFAEGVTSTYGAYTLLRSGIWSRSQFYADLASQISYLDGRSARLWKSVEEASLDAWLEKYDFYNRPESSISYYNKGQIVGVMLDLLIRNLTDNHASLDDILRALNEQYARHGRFYDDSAGILAVVEQVAGKNPSFEEFFVEFVSGTIEIPYDNFLAMAGLHLKSQSQTVGDFGFEVERATSGNLVITQVDSGSNAQAAGLREGDTLLELNGEAFPRNLMRWEREHKPGETVHLHVRRGNEDRTLTFALGETEQANYEIEELPHANDKQQRIREGLLHGTTTH
jgi:predicted metalloprotease with PDZ domain